MALKHFIFILAMTNKIAKCFCFFCQFDLLDAFFFNIKIN
jgi:hypothetical protein